MRRTARSSRRTRGTRPADLPGPFAVGRYARKLQAELQGRARVSLIGEVFDLHRSKAQVHFELRDSEGGVPCSIWLRDLESLGLAEGALHDGAEVVTAGGPDYYPGGLHASPKFVLRATHLRLAGEGDLMISLEALRKQLRYEGLFALQKQLARPVLPKTIGVVTAEEGAARRDLVAGLRRRSWAGRLVWAFAPVQDRHAAPQITTLIQDLAARPEVEVIVITRGGGSLADMWAFCDETLCRTVAMLRVPVIAAIGHERDSTLIDDVAAVACSTPTHAAEVAVPVDCLLARQELGRSAAALRRARDIVIGRRGEPAVARWAARVAKSASLALERQSGALRHREIVLRAHDPKLTFERGYARVESLEGEPVRSAAAALAAAEVSLSFADGSVEAAIGRRDGGGVRPRSRFRRQRGERS
jgi:exodeoxyribonuclease VII large subunit